jgi:hypothetical protein
VVLLGRWWWSGGERLYVEEDDVLARLLEVGCVPDGGVLEGIGIDVVGGILGDKR